MSRLTAIAISLSLTFSSGSVNADSEFPTPDIVSCLKSIESLDQRYRGAMQIQCVAVAGEICFNVDKETATCMPDLVASLREFYDDLMPLLPPEIEGNGLLKAGYKRALERARDSFENPPECDDLDSYDYSVCELLQLGSTTIDLVYRARLADVEIP